MHGRTEPSVEEALKIRLPVEISPFGESAKFRALQAGKRGRIVRKPAGRSGCQRLLFVLTIVKRREPATMSDVAGAVREITEIARKHHLDYDQTRYVFKEVRKRLGLKPPRRRRGTVERLSAGEKDRFLQAGFHKSATTGLMMTALYETALRVSEFVDLRASDVLFGEGPHGRSRVVVRHGKGQRRREVPITKNLAYALQVHLRDRQRGYLFESNRHGRFTPRRIQQIVKEVADRAALTKRVTPHVLRHTRATLLAEEGMSKDLLQVFLGHEKPETTEIYTYTAALDMQRGFDEATGALE